MTRKVYVTMKTDDENKFIAIVPTVSIARDFYNTDISFLSSLMTDSSMINEFVCLRVKYGAFEEFKKSFINNIILIITTYSSESKRLGSLIEFMNNQNKKRKTLILTALHK